METVLEYEWWGDFVRILPARGCNYYEKYYQHQAPIQRFIYQFFFENEMFSWFQSWSNNAHENQLKLSYEPKRIESKDTSLNES